MKKLLMLFCAGALISVLCAGFTACNENGELSNEQRRIEMAKLTDDIYYVAGAWSNSAVFQEDGTAKSTHYVFISENLKDTVGVYNCTEDGLPDKLLDGIFEFPAEIMPGDGGCGIFLFPKEYRYSYPVVINSHRPLKENEGFGIPCIYLGITSSIRINKSIVVESLSKIEKR